MTFIFKNKIEITESLWNSHTYWSMHFRYDRLTKFAGPNLGLNSFEGIESLGFIYTNGRS